MSAQRLAILVVLVAVLISSAFAQTYERSDLLNELSVTVGALL